jgi:Fe-S cluster assembly iron-binding protein IscA
MYKLRLGIVQTGCDRLQFAYENASIELIAGEGVKELSDKDFYLLLQNTGFKASIDDKSIVYEKVEDAPEAIAPVTTPPESTERKKVKPE